MTREEAIDKLQDLWNEVYNEDSDGYIYAEALDMAIDALSANCTTEKPNDVVEQKNDVVAEPTDLISRADAIEAVEQEYRIDRGYMVDDYTYGFNQAIQYVSDIILQDLPSADRPSGEWIIRDDMPKLDNTYSIECSKCGQLMFGHYNADNPNYCPNCGAKMGGNK